MATEPLSTEELHERVERRQLGPEGQGHRAVVFREVQIENRRVDSISFGLWHSRGYKVDVFELKTNRADWEREYEDHGKAEPAMAHADHFWLVTNPGIVEPHELPEKWGHLEAPGRRRKLKVVKPAPLLRPDSPPLDRGIVTSFIRQASYLRAEREREIREGERAEQRAGSEFDFNAAQRRVERAEEEAERMRTAFQAFRDHAGFEFLNWSPSEEDMEVLARVGKALKEGPKGLEWLLSGIKHQEDRAVEARRHLKEARKAIEETAA